MNNYKIWYKMKGKRDSETYINEVCARNTQQAKDIFNGTVNTDKIYTILKVRRD